MISKRKVDTSKVNFLKSIQPIIKAALRPAAVYPCEIGEGDHHLWIRGSQPEARNGMSRRKPGYWDISVVPLKRQPFVVLRIWTYDGGSGINQKLANGHFTTMVCSKRPGLKWCADRQIGTDKSSGHGLYDFYRDGVEMSSSFDVNQLAYNFTLRNWM